MAPNLHSGTLSCTVDILIEFAGICILMRCLIPGRNLHSIALSPKIAHYRPFCKIVSLLA